MGCGGSKDIAKSNAPNLSTIADTKDVVVKENPISEISRPPSLAAVDEVEPKSAIEAPQPTVISEPAPEAESAAVTGIVVEHLKVQDPEPSPIATEESNKIAIDTTLSSGTNDINSAERSISMAISSTDINNFANTEGITLEIPPPADDNEWTLSVTPVSRPASTTSLVIPERESSPSLLGEALNEEPPNTAIALQVLAARDESLSSPKAIREDLRTPNGVHSLQHADTGESCFGFQQLNLMELGPSSAAELVYDEEEGGVKGSSSSQPHSHHPARTLSGFHNPRVEDMMSRQSSVAHLLHR